MAGFDHEAMGRVAGFALVDVVGTLAIGGAIALAGGSRSLGSAAGVVASTFLFGWLVHASLGIKTRVPCPCVSAPRSL